MKRMHTLWRSGVALVLVLSLMVGMCGSIFAYEPGETINYVSIGDSMANGYGFVGYKQQNATNSDYDFVNDVNVYGNGAYPLQFEEYLAEQGYVVNHTKLAPSALLAEDLLWLLGGREEFDDGWDGFKDYVGDYDESPALEEELMPYFQEAITNADIITMGIGNASFGAFMLDRVTNALGVLGGSLEGEPVLNFEEAIKVLELDAEQYELVMQMYDMMEAELITSVPADIVAQYNLEQVLDIVSYTAASYVVNYKLVVEKILEMNPDVEIVLVGLLNTTYGMNITDENGNVLVPFGDMMDATFGMLNAYMAGLPTVLQAQGVAPEATFYYAEQPEPKFICQEFDALLENNWGVIDNGRLDGSLVRQRNIDAYNNNLAPMIGMAVTGAPLVKITLADVEAYEALDWEALKTGAGQYWDPWGAFVFSGYDTNSETAVAKIMSVAIYLAIEEAVAVSTDSTEIQLSGLMKIAGDLSSVFGDLGNPPTDSPESTRTWLLEGLTTEETSGMCKIYGLFKVGNGMSVHPTPSGHDEIAAAVIAAYESGYTAKDETISNLTAAAEAVAALAAEYGDDALRYAYAAAEEAGLIDAAKTELAALQTELEALRVWAEAEAAQLGEELYNELMVALDEAEAAVDAALKLLNTKAEEMTSAMLNELKALMVSLNQSLTYLEQTITNGLADLDAALQAELNALLADLQVKGPAALAAAQAALEEVLATANVWLQDKLGEAYDALVNAIVEAAKTYAPEIDQWIYDYLYNNPEVVLAFLNEYGDDAVAFMEQYQKEILMVLGYLVITFGDDVAEYVMDNADTVLKAMCAMVEEHGDEAWALIDVYLKAMGIDVESSLREAIQAAGDLAAKYGEEALKYAYQTVIDSGVIDAAIAQMEALQAELEALRAWAENSAAQLGDAYDELMDALADAEAAIDAALKLLNTKAEDMTLAMVNELKALLAELTQSLADLEKAMQDAMADLDAAAKAELEALLAELNAKAVAALTAAQAALEDVLACADAWLQDKLGEAYDAVVDALVDVAETYGPEAAQWLYTYLVEHPAEILAFLSEYGDDAIAFIEQYQKEIVAVLDYLINNFGDDVAEYVMSNADTILKVLCELICEYGDEAWALIDAYMNELGIYDALSNPENIQAALDALADLVEKYGPAILEGAFDFAEQQGYIDALEQAIENLKGCIDEEVNDFINNVKPSMEANIAALQAKLAELEAELAALQAELNENLQVMLADLEAELARLYAELETATGEAKAQIEAAIAEVEKAIAEVEAMIAEIEAAIAEIEAMIEAINAEIEELIEALAQAEAEIKALIEEAAKLEAAIRELIDMTINGLEGNVHGVLAEIQKAINDVATLVNSVKAAINSAISAVEEFVDILEALDADVAALKGAILDMLSNLDEKLAALLDGALNELDAAIKAELEAVAAEIQAAIEAQLKAAADAALAALADAADALLDEMKAMGEDLVDVLANEADKLMDIVIADWQRAYLDATTGEYTVTDDSYYLSLGDSTATGIGVESYEVYSYLLAEELGLDIATQYASLAEAGLRAEDLRYILDEDYEPDAYTLDNLKDVDATRADYVAEIEKADLITINFGTNNFTTFATEQVTRVTQGKNPYEMNWNTYLNEDGVAYVDEALADMYEEIMATGVTAEVADMLILMVESYAYGYVGFAFNYAEVLNEIHTINPDAQVIVIGGYNPVEGFEVNLNGTNADISGLADELVKLTNLHFTVYSMLTPNTTFVPAEDVETFLDADIANGEYVNVTPLTYLWALIDNDAQALHATANGHVYIKDQILNALTVTDGRHYCAQNLTFVASVEPTCEEAGNVAYWTCSCGKIYADAAATIETTLEAVSIAALGHHAGDAVIENRVDPTCDVDGSFDVVFYCTVCGAELSRTTTVIPATGKHVASEAVIENEVAATCTTAGSYDMVIYCADCGEEIFRTTIAVPATGHTAGDAVTENEVAATCTENGSYDTVVYCSVCSEELSRNTTVVPAIGHAYGDWQYHSGTQHKRICANDASHVEYANHRFEDGTCADCGCEDVNAPFDCDGGKNCPSDPYTDVDQTQWYHESIDYCIENGLMNGMTSTTFAPQGSLTRAQLVTILYRIAGEPDVDGKHPFVDMPNSWYQDQILWAYENGITTGMSATTFAPDKPVTREQVAVFMARFAEYMDCYSGRTTDISHFRDHASVSSWAVAGMKWAVAEGLFQGNGHSCLNPNNTATRAEASALLMRYCVNIMGR